MNYFPDLKRNFYFMLIFGFVIALNTVMFLDIALYFFTGIVSVTISLSFLIVTVAETRRLKAINKLRENGQIHAYLQKIQALDKRGLSSKQKMSWTVNAAIAHLDLGDYPAFLTCMNSVIEYAEKKKNQRLKANYHYNMAIYYLCINDLNNVNKHLLKAKAIVPRLGKAQKRHYLKSMEYINYNLAFKEGRDSGYEQYLIDQLSKSRNLYTQVTNHYYLYEYYKTKNDDRFEEHKNFVLTHAHDMYLKKLV